MAQPVEGQIIVLQAANLVQTRKTIPDYATWSQCYAIYIYIYKAVLAAQQPQRLAYLMGYQSLIARVSMKYKWPAWVIYDQNFWQWATQTSHGQRKIYPMLHRAGVGQQKLVQQVPGTRPHVNGLPLSGKEAPMDFNGWKRSRHSKKRTKRTTVPQI